MLSTIACQTIGQGNVIEEIDWLPKRVYILPGIVSPETQPNFGILLQLVLQVVVVS